MTKYKKLILDIVNSSYEHLTAEEIYQEAIKNYPKMVLSTIYNNLNTLVLENLVRRITIEGCPDRFDHMNKHDHLICIKCHKLKDIYITDLTKLLKKEIGNDYLRYDLKISYVCDECKNKS